MMINSVLIIDDDLNHARQIAEYFKSQGAIKAVPTRHPSHGVSLAVAENFDLVIVDITIGYRGNPFGGLDIYRHLRGKYGRNGLLAYSQYVDDHVLERFGESLNFIERDYSLNGWEEDLYTEALRLRALQTCFVAIPFGDEFSLINSTIMQSISQSKYTAVRIDESVFTESIIDKIFSEIFDSRFVVMVADGRNPNVYLEAGYALASNKQVISAAESVRDLPFDIQSKNSILHRGDMGALGRDLHSTLNKLTLG